MASLAEIEQLHREIDENARKRTAVLTQATAELQGRSIQDLVSLKKYWEEVVSRNRKLDDRSTELRNNAEYYVEAIEQLLRNPPSLSREPDSIKLGDSSKSDDNPENMSAEEAASYLRISVSTLYKMTSKDVIPFRKIGGKLLSFRKDELDAYLQSQRNRTVDETERDAETYLSQKRSKKGPAAR